MVEIIIHVGQVHCIIYTLDINMYALCRAKVTNQYEQWTFVENMALARLEKISVKERMFNAPVI